MTGDTALRLGHFFGTGAEFWHNLKKLYELRLAQDEAGEASTTIKALSTLPACGNARSATASGHQREPDCGLATSPARRHERRSADGRRV